MYKSGSSGAAIALILLILVIIAFLFLFHSNLAGSGLGSILGSSKPNSSLPSSYSVLTSVSPQMILPGANGTVLFTYYNPFNQQLNTYVDFTLNSPAYISISNPTRQVTMPSTMSATSSINFVVQCASDAPQVSSSSVFNVWTNNVVQNLTSSIIVYPSNTPADQIPNQIYSLQPGFLTISMPSIEFQTVSTSAQTTTNPQNMNLMITPSVENGQPTTITSGLPNDEINSITIILDNSSGVFSSASIYYNGQNIQPKVVNKNLEWVLQNVPMDLISSGIMLTVTGFNSLSSPTQNLVHVSVNYNYFYSLTGPTISCS